MKRLSQTLRTRLIGVGLGSVLSALTLTAGLSGVTPPAVAAVTPLSSELNIARYGHTATTLPDGNILIVGGVDANGDVLSDAEIFVFDETNPAFVVAAPLSTPRTGHTATLVDGKVLVVGGSSSINGEPLSSTEIFDPETQTWLDGPSLQVPRDGHSATPIGGGQVLIAGGGYASTEILTLTGSSEPGSLTTPRTGHGAVKLTDGRLLLAGGDGGDDTAELYADGNSTPVDDFMGAGRVSPDLRVLPDGKVLVSGGDGAGTFEVFNPDPQVRVPGFNAVAQAFNDSNDAEQVLSAQTRAAILYDGSPAGAIANRDLYATAETADGQVLVAGGVRGENEVLADAYLIDGSPALITTDQTDYSPGQNVLLSGQGFGDESVGLKLYKVKNGESTIIDLGSVDADAGQISAEIFSPVEPDDVDATFTLTAVGQQSGFVAQTAFTDAAVGDVTVACSPSPVLAGKPTTCTATIAGNTGQPATERDVTFTSTGSGSFSPTTCKTTGSNQEASCSVIYTPTAVGTGTHLITASHEFSPGATRSGTFSLGVLPGGTIIVEKQTDPDGATGSFQYTGDAAGTISDGGQIVVSNLEPGTYTSVESPTAGFTLTSIACDDASSANASSGNVGTSTATFKLDPGETVKCTFTNTRVNKDLTVSKTATASFGRTYKWLIDKSVDKTQINIADGGTATFNYSVKVTPDGYTDSAWVVSGKITVSNPNSVAVSGVNVTDAIDNGGVCTVTGGTNVTVPASGNVVLDYSCAYAAAPSLATGTNTANATWDPATYGTPNGSAAAKAGVDFAAVTPSETNKTINVIDDKTNPPTPVTLGTADYYAGPFEFTYWLDKSGVAGTCTDYKNTAKIDETEQSDSQTVKVCVGKDLTVSKTAAGTFDRSYLWTITKDVDQTSVKIAEGSSHTFHYTVNVKQTGISDSGWKLSGKVTISNPNDWEDITLTSLTDAVNNGGTCTVDPGPYVVPKSGSLNVNYSCSYASAPSSNSGTNTVTATWDKDTASTPTGTASGSAPFTLTQLGSTNTTVHVTDTYSGDLGTVTGTDSAPFMDATFTYNRTESGVAGTCTTYDNTAKIVETEQSANQSVKVCVGKDLTVSKTATPTFTRTWDWTITKDYDGSYNLFAGDTVTHGYKVTVTPTSTDSAWKVDGKITISNPNDWHDIMLTGLTDVANDGTCTVDPTLPIVPKGGSVDVNYSCTWASQPSSFSGTNTATATWDKATAFTPSGSASGTANFAFGEPTTEINPVITVDDSNLTGESWSANRAPFEWTYTEDFLCSTELADYTDGHYFYALTNTAKINETGQPDTAKVDVTCYWPQIELIKTGDALSKIGDGVTYKIKLENNTPTDAVRDLSCTISDPTIGFNKTVTLASGESYTSTETFTIPTTASDPFFNTASVTCSPLDSEFSVSDEDSWSTNLFQPAVEIVKKGPAYGFTGDTIEYTFTINNSSSPDSPNLMLHSLSDDVLGDLKTDAQAACDDLEPGASCTFTVNYTAPADPGQVTNIVTVHYHPKGFPNDITDTDEHTVTVVPRSQVTSSSLCIFDRDAVLPGQQFRSLFTQDPQAFPTYKMTATNPGQFYYNVFATGEPGVEATFAVTLPYPFVTQGAMPVHAYSGVEVNTSGETCFEPTDEFFVDGQQVVLSDYRLKYGEIDSVRTTSFDVTVTIPASGFVYLAIHLDYGLKGSRGYSTDTQANATDSSGKTLIPNLADHTFEVTDAQTDETTVQNMNVFKKNPGVGGMVVTAASTNPDQPPFQGATVQLKKGNTLVGTAQTDEDGWHLINYKHTGKAADFNVVLSNVPGKPGYTETKKVTLKANAYSEVNFELK